MAALSRGCKLRIELARGPYWEKYIGRVLFWQVHGPQAKSMNLRKKNDTNIFPLPTEQASS